MFTKWWTASSMQAKKRKLMHTCRLMFIMLLVLVIAGCSLLPAEEEEEQLPTITAPKLSQKPEHSVKKDTIEIRVRGTGKLMSTLEDSVAFNLDGKTVKDVYVKPGDYVTAGQLIAEVDVLDQERALRRQELEFQRDELDMILRLREAEDLSPEELAQYQIDFELKRNDLADLREEIGQAKVYAPFAGTVIQVQTEKGNTTKAHEPIAMIANTDDLAVAISLSKDNLKKVSPGMPTTIEINGVGKFEGKIERLPVEESEDNNMGGYPYPQQPKETIDQFVTVILDEALPDTATRGIPLNASIVIERKEDVLVIPPSALRSYGGRSYVQVVDKDGNKSEVDVEIGTQTSTQVEIVQGLTAGQKVVGR